MSDRDRYPPRAVMFGGASSVFPVQLADHWRRRGVDVAIVSYDRVRRGTTTPGGAVLFPWGFDIHDFADSPTRAFEAARRKAALGRVARAAGRSVALASMPRQAFSATDRSRVW